MATESEEAPAKVERTPEQMARRKAIRVVGYQGWLAEWNRANPEATAEARKAAWAEAKSLRMRDARRVMKRLEKNGLMIVPAPEAVAAE